MIGVFDSGIGGLTVLKDLQTKLSHESFVYLGDTARLPYGAKSPQTIKKYLKQNIQFLLTHNVKAIVVACNSASSVLDSNDSWPIPVYDVITPSAEMAAKVSMDERVGVIATRVTVEQKSYSRALQKINPHISVYQQACPLLVPLVEEGWIDDPLTNLVVYRYLNPILQARVDTLILGCTHYPLLTKAIQKVTGSNVQLISSAQAVTEKIAADIKAGVVKENKEPSTLRVFTTDINPTFKAVAQRLFHPNNFPDVELVNI